MADQSFESIVLGRLDRQDRTLDQQNKLLEEIRTNTNGRLRGLELWQARADGAKAAFHWLPALLAGVLGSGVGALIGVLAAHG